MKPQIVIPLVLAMLSLSVCAQEGKKSVTAATKSGTSGSALRSTLRIKSSFRTGFLGPAFNRVACDDEGNLYARRLRSGDKARGPVEEIGPSGDLFRSFKVEDPLLDLSIADFFVASGDEVYMVGWSMENVHAGSRIYVARFGRDGSLKSRTQIASEEFFPSNLAVFKSGELLLTGTEGPSDNTPFTGVFASDGRLIAKIHEPGDEDLRIKAEAGDASVHEAGIYGNAAVEMGAAVSGSDGNVYLMRRTSPALIYAISPRGEVVRKLRIDPGEFGSLPEELQSSGDRLALSFTGPDGARVVRVVDLKGIDIATYDIDPNLPAGPLACYNPPALTFLGADNEGAHSYMRLEKLQEK